MLLVRWFGAALLVGLPACSASRLDAEARAKLPHSVAPSAPEVEVTRSDAPYAVSGASAAELRQSMLDHARATWTDPDGAGMTQVKLGAELRCQEYSDGAALSQAKLTLALTVYLPSWQGRAQAAAPLQAAWDSFASALRTHEEGHVAIANRHAAAMRQALQAMKLEASCPELMDRVKTLIYRADAAMMKEQLDYDAKTNHGATQGCVL